MDGTTIVDGLLLLGLGNLSTRDDAELARFVGHFWELIAAAVVVFGRYRLI